MSVSTASKSVRERIADIHERQLRGQTTPSEAAQWLAVLGALVGNVLAEIRDAEADYTAVYVKHLDTEGKANRAEIRAALTPEFKRLREGRDLLKQVEHQMATLKYLVKAHETEARLSR